LCQLPAARVSVAGLAAKGDFEELMQYSGTAGYKPDYLYLMQRMMMDNPEAAVNLAKMVARQPGPPIDLNTMTDLFLQRNAVREATAFLLDVLQDNKPEHAMLQTKAWPAIPPLAPSTAPSGGSASGMRGWRAGQPGPRNFVPFLCRDPICGRQIGSIFLFCKSNRTIVVLLVA
jgi:hypothetical protein